MSNEKEENIPREQKSFNLEKLIGGIFIPPGRARNFSPKNEKSKISESRIDALSSKKRLVWDVSVSPDGKHILKFNKKTLEFSIISRNDKGKGSETNSYVVKGEFEQATSNNWVVAISDCVTEQNDIYVAISCVEKFDMTKPKFYMTKPDKPKSDVHNYIGTFYDEKDEEYEASEGSGSELTVKIHGGKQQHEQQHGRTVIFRVNLNSHSKNKIHTQPGGIVTLVHSKKEESIKKTYCFVFNVNGIHRSTLFNCDLKDQDNFAYPKRLQNELETLYKNKSCKARLNDCIYDHYFFIEQYKEGTQVLQLYNLESMKLEQIFDMREIKSLKKIGNPIFARSKNERIIAYSSGFRKIRLFLKANGLEIASVDFSPFLNPSENFGDVKILFCDFINDDKTLIVIIQKSDFKTGKVLFWNLFSTKHKIKIGKDVNFEKDEDDVSFIARELVTISSDGVPFSVLDKLIDDDEFEEEGVDIYSIVIHKEKAGTPNNMPTSKAKAKRDDELVNHIIYHRIDPRGNETIPFAKNKEPWLTEDYERTSVYLDKEENMQLSIGRSTVQVWRKDKVSGKKFLEYIWTNNAISDRVEYKLDILELYVGERCFYLKVRWRELNDGEFVEVKWPYEDNHVTPIKHACDALEHFNHRRNKLVGYAKQYVFEYLKDQITYIIWRFIKHEPDIWRLMDSRFDVMAKIIIGGSNALIKYILFGKKNQNLHVPRLYRWEDKKEYKLKDHYKKARSEKMMDIKNLSDLQIAIRLCEGGLEGNRRTLIVAYLLEYYMENSLKHIGWLITVSEALPDLYHYKLENYAKELFYKRCISGLEISNIIEYTDFTPEEIQSSFQISPKFIAFNPILKLISKNKKQESISLFLKKLYLNIFNPTIKNPSMTVKIIPLHKFTVSKIPQKQRHKSGGSKLVKIFKLLFIPRGYLDDDNKKNKDPTSQLSPLVQVIRAEKDDDIFDNPAMEAIIDYKWIPARNYFLQLFFMYILFAACFATLGGCYVGHVDTTGYLSNFFGFLFVAFYYLGGYLFLVECRQFQHHTWRHYLEFFNFVDLASIVTSLVIMSVYISPSFKLINGFADVQTTQNITVAISFTMLLLWFEFMLYLRLLSEPAKYLYIVLNIIQKTYVFVLFMLMVVLALSHAFLILLQHPDFTHLTAKISTSTLTLNDGEIVGKITNDFDPINDNPSKNFINSFLSTYSWLRGYYVQGDVWDFWAVQVLILFGSLFLITVVQNIFIAFIWGVYAEAYEKGRVALLRFRAELISDYEALDEIYFSSLPLEPKYIYYLGKSKSYDPWEKAVKKREKENVKLYHDYELKMNEAGLSFEETYENPFWNYNNSNSSSETLNDKVDDDEDNNDDSKIEKLKSKVDELLKLLEKK